MLVPHTVTHTPSLFVVLHYRVQRDVVSLCVYKDGDWLQLDILDERYDSINTLVMHCATAAIPIPVGDHVVLTHLQYPVHSSQYYKQRSSHTVWKFVLTVKLSRNCAWTFCPLAIFISLYFRYLFNFYWLCVIVASSLTSSRGVGRIFEMGEASLVNCKISGLETSVMFIATEDDGAGTVARD